MDHRKVSEYRLAAETGVPQATINRILKGVSVDPKTDTVRPLAAFFGITVEDLRGTSPEIQIREEGLTPEALEFLEVWLSLPRARRQAHKDGIFLEAQAFKYTPGLKGKDHDATGRFFRRTTKKEG